MGRQFEDKWLRECLNSKKSMLAEPDFSATTDSYSIIGNTSQVKSFPIDRRFVYELIIATLLSFVTLSAVPLDVLLESVTKFLL
jgi:hypothetical protein